MKHTRLIRLVVTDAQVAVIRDWLRKNETSREPTMDDYLGTASPELEAKILAAQMDDVLANPEFGEHHLAECINLEQ